MWTMDLDEWLAYWQVALGDDSIGVSEFSDFYGVFGLAVSLAETVFVELDTNGDGVISRAELTELSRQFYRGNDLEAAGNVLFGPYGA